MLFIISFSLSHFIALSGAISGSEWYPSDYVAGDYYYTEDLYLDYNITIDSGATLRLENLTIYLRDNILFTIESGGSLIMRNVFVISQFDEFIYNIAFQVKSTGSLTIENSRIQDLGVLGSDLYYTGDRIGIWAGENASLNIRNTIFTHNNKRCPFLRLYKPGSGSIYVINNTFIEPEHFVMEVKSYSIYIEDSFANPNIYISNNSFSNTMPIVLYNVKDTALIGNKIKSKLSEDTAFYHTGVYLSQSDNITLKNNLVENRYEGIKIEASSDVNLINNTITNANFLVYCDYSSANVNFTNNIFEVKEMLNSEVWSVLSLNGENYTFGGNRFNLEYTIHRYNDIFDVYYSNMSSIEFSTQSPNLLNSKVIKYVHDIYSYKVYDFSSDSSIGLLMLYNIRNGIVRNVYCSNSAGVYIYNCENITFENVNVFNSVRNGMYIRDSTNISMNGIITSGNKEMGVDIDGINHGNIINLTAKYNTFGIIVHWAQNFSIANSTIIDNGDPTEPIVIDDYTGVPVYEEIGAGILVKSGEEISIIGCNIWHNYYWGIVLGTENSSYLANCTVKSNKLGQYIDILEKRYGVSAVDNSLYPDNSNTTWVGNEYSEQVSANGIYNIPGQASNVDRHPVFYDTDGDGVSDITEIVWGSDYLSLSDTDFDGLSDFDEIFTYKSNPNNTDTDGDGLIDGDEIYITFSDPTLVDTDGDGYSDKYEYEMNTDPNDPESYPGDNVREHDIPESQYSEPEKNISIDGFPLLAVFISIFIGVMINKRRYKAKANKV